MKTLDGTASIKFAAVGIALGIALMTAAAPSAALADTASTDVTIIQTDTSRSLDTEGNETAAVTITGGYGRSGTLAQTGTDTLAPLMLFCGGAAASAAAIVANGAERQRSVSDF